MYLQYSSTIIFLQIYSLIDEKIDREDGPKVLEYILVGLSVKPDASSIVEKVLNIIKY